MNHHYADIRDRIPEPPKWWDEHAVPRYCDFMPDATADIYAHEVALVEIACQDCGTRFAVCFSWNDHAIGYDENGKPWVRARGQMTPERVRKLHYGDPPNAGCCDAGRTMNSEPIRVLEFWRKGGEEFTKPDPEHPTLRICLPGYFDWRRVPELEIVIDCEWRGVGTEPQ